MWPNYYRYLDVAENLIKKGRLAGTLSGGHSERAIFLPDIYAKSQNEWVDAFYHQNGYLGNIIILETKSIKLPLIILFFSLSNLL